MKTKLLYDLSFFTKICWNMYFELFTTDLKSAPVQFLYWTDLVQWKKSFFGTSWYLWKQQND